MEESTKRKGKAVQAVMFVFFIFLASFFSSFFLFASDHLFFPWCLGQRQPFPSTPRKKLKRREAGNKATDDLQDIQGSQEQEQGNKAGHDDHDQDEHQDLFDHNEAQEEQERQDDVEIHQHQTRCFRQLIDEEEVDLESERVIWEPLESTHHLVQGEERRTERIEVFSILFPFCWLLRLFQRVIVEWKESLEEIQWSEGEWIVREEDLNPLYTGSRTTIIEHYILLLQLFLRFNFSQPQMQAICKVIAAHCAEDDNCCGGLAQVEQFFDVGSDEVLHHIYCPTCPNEPRDSCLFFVEFLIDAELRRRFQGNKYFVQACYSDIYSLCSFGS